MRLFNKWLLASVIATVPYLNVQAVQAFHCEPRDLPGEARLMRAQARAEREIRTALSYRIVEFDDYTHDIMRDLPLEFATDCESRLNEANLRIAKVCFPKDSDRESQLATALNDYTAAGKKFVGDLFATADPNASSVNQDRLAWQNAAKKVADVWKGTGNHKSRQAIAEFWEFYVGEEIATAEALVATTSNQPDFIMASNLRSTLLDTISRITPLLISGF